MTEQVSSEQSDTALTAIREALRRPMVLSAEQEQAFHEFRKRSLIRRYNTIRLVRRGKLKYRRVGVAGADLPVHPVEWDLRNAHKRYIAQLAALIPRDPPATTLAVAARQRSAADRRAPVLAAWALYAGRGRHRTGLVARKTGEKPHYIRWVIRESVRDRKD
jgi:hypothetical protein